MQRPTHHPITKAVPSVPKAAAKKVPAKNLKVSAGPGKPLTRITGLFTHTDKRGLTFYSGTQQDSGIPYFLMPTTNKGSIEVTGFELKYKNEEGQYITLGKAIEGKDKAGNNYMSIKSGEDFFYVYDFEARV